MVELTFLLINEIRGEYKHVHAINPFLFCVGNDEVEIMNMRYDTLCKTDVKYQIVYKYENIVYFVNGSDVNMFIVDGMKILQFKRQFNKNVVKLFSVDKLEIVLYEDGKVEINRNHVEENVIDIHISENYLYLMQSSSLLRIKLDSSLVYEPYVSSDKIKLPEFNAIHIFKNDLILIVCENYFTLRDLNNVENNANKVNNYIHEKDAIYHYDLMHDHVIITNNKSDEYIYFNVKTMSEEYISDEIGNLRNKKSKDNLVLSTDDISVDGSYVYLLNKESVMVFVDKKEENLEIVEKAEIEIKEYQNIDVFKNSKDFRKHTEFNNLSSVKNIEDEKYNIDIENIKSESGSDFKNSFENTNTHNEETVDNKSGNLEENSNIKKETESPISDYVIEDKQTDTSNSNDVKNQKKESENISKSNLDQNINKGTGNIDLFASSMLGSLQKPTDYNISSTYKNPFNLQSTDNAKGNVEQSNSIFNSFSQPIKPFNTSNNLSNNENNNIDTKLNNLNDETANSNYNKISGNSCAKNDLNSILDQNFKFDLFKNEGEIINKSADNENIGRKVNPDNMFNNPFNVQNDKGFTQPNILNHYKNIDNFQNISNSNKTTYGFNHEYDIKENQNIYQQEYNQIKVSLSNDFEDLIQEFKSIDNPEYSYEDLNYSDSPLDILLRNVYKKILHVNNNNLKHDIEYKLDLLDRYLDNIKSKDYSETVNYVDNFLINYDNKDFHTSYNHIEDINEGIKSISIEPKHSIIFELFNSFNIYPGIDENTDKKASRNIRNSNKTKNDQFILENKTTYEFRNNGETMKQNEEGDKLIQNDQSTFFNNLDLTHTPNSLNSFTNITETNPQLYQQQSETFNITSGFMNSSQNNMNTNNPFLSTSNATLFNIINENQQQGNLNLNQNQNQDEHQNLNQPQSQNQSNTQPGNQSAFSKLANQRKRFF